MENTEFTTTIDHEVIRAWFENHQAVPAVINKTENNGEGILVVKFQNSDSALQEISWQEFLDTFEYAKLAFRYDGEIEQPGMFAYNFIKREDRDLDSSDDQGRELPEDDIPVENLFGSASETDDGVISLSEDININPQEL